MSHHSWRPRWDCARGVSHQAVLNLTTVGEPLQTPDAAVGDKNTAAVAEHVGIL